jgi:hypothetical protein
MEPRHRLHPDKRGLRELLRGADGKAAGRIPFFDKKDVLGETIQEWPR